MQYFDSALADEPFPAVGRRLFFVVQRAQPSLQAIPSEEAGVPRAPGKWSRKEILGHLIDSAANNHQRFVRGQLDPRVRQPGYAQEHWVATQRYAERPWPELVDLWSAYNRHLAHVIAAIPESRRDIECEIGGGPTVTLSWVALDYVGHAEHHLRQILDGL